MRIILRAYAKLNLDLRVGGRRSDGYHEVRTVFQAIRLHDTLVVESTPRKAFSLVGDASVMPPGEENLAWKAAAILWQAVGRQGAPRGARVTIRKRIPTRAGLGGGSSDAAATLIGLSQLWRVRLAPKALLSLAATLGADVPFFLIGGSALGLSRGDEVHPLIDRPLRHVVIVRPEFGIVTKDAYEWLAEARAKAPLDYLFTAGPRSRDEFGNDFESVVEARHPEVRQIRERLVALGATLARLSGSGSAVFGIFDTATRARRAVTNLRRPDWKVWQTTTVRRAQKQRDFAANIASGGL